MKTQTIMSFCMTATASSKAFFWPPNLSPWTSSSSSLSSSQSSFFISCLSLSLGIYIYLEKRFAACSVALARATHCCRYTCMMHERECPRHFRVLSRRRLLNRSLSLRFLVPLFLFYHHSFRLSLSLALPQCHSSAFLHFDG